MSAVSLPSDLSRLEVIESPKSLLKDFEGLLNELSPEHFYSRENFMKLLQKYGEEDLQRIWNDLKELQETTFKDVTQNHYYVVTGGGPGAGKSTFVENWLENRDRPELSYPDVKFAYIDPDRSCLFYMASTYQADLASQVRTADEAYTYWREASNFLSNYFLGLAMKEGYDIAHGSTMASPFAKSSLQKIQSIYHYHTTMLHFTCEETTRRESHDKRISGGVVQCTEKDFVEKQTLFYSLISDYLQAVNKVHFYYRASMEVMVDAAIFEGGQLTINNTDATNGIRQAHDRALSQEGFWDSAFGI